MKFDEKLGYLQRGLERRLKNLPDFIENREKQMQEINKTRKTITDRIEKYKDDEVIINVLNSTLNEFDRKYKDVPLQYKTAIHEAQSTIKSVEKLHERIENLDFDKEFLELVVDCFLNNVVLDWKAFEELEKDKEAKDNG